MAGIDTLKDEIREDYQIPPYFPDSSLKRIIQEGIAYFEMLNPGCDFEKDLVYRNLLKTRSYYSYVHALNDFRENYKTDILTWQAETPVETAADGGDES